MHRPISLLVAAVALSLSSLALAGAPAPLVDSVWLARHLGAPEIVVLDVRAERDYLAAHVPGAVHTAYGGDGWRITDTAGTPGMLPADGPGLVNLTATIAALGIGSDSHVVLVPYGHNESDVGVATRIYWTFKVLGHDAVSILDGGMRAYQAASQPVDAGAVVPASASFTAALRQDMLIDADAVTRAMDKGTALLDARPDIQHIGLQQSQVVARAGTIPGAQNLPAAWQTENSGGVFRDADNLRRLYGLAGAPTDEPVIAFCNTGHWASVTWFVSSELLGNAQARLYDGSMAEWAANDDNPVARAFAID